MIYHMRKMLFPEGKTKALTMSNSGYRNKDKHNDIMRYIIFI